MIVTASGSNSASPPSATGSSAMIVVMVVRMIGLSLARPLSMIASLMSILFSFLLCSMKSISTTAFLTTIPARDTIPMTPMNDRGVWVTNRPMKPPLIDRKMLNTMSNGSTSELNSNAMTRYTSTTITANSTPISMKKSVWSVASPPTMVSVLSSISEERPSIISSTFSSLMLFSYSYTWLLLSSLVIA